MGSGTFNGCVSDGEGKGKGKGLRDDGSGFIPILFSSVVFSNVRYHGSRFHYGWGRGREADFTTVGHIATLHYSHWSHS